MTVPEPKTCDTCGRTFTWRAKWERNWNEVRYCPSEAARAVGGDRWRSEMEPARQAARRLVAAGMVELTQGGRVVDPSGAKAPIRLRLAR